MESADRFALSKTQYSDLDSDDAGLLELLDMEYDEDMEEEKRASGRKDFDMLAEANPPSFGLPSTVEAVKTILLLHDGIIRRDQGADLLVKLVKLRAQRESHDEDPIAAASENPFRKYLASASPGSKSGVKESSRLEIDASCRVLPKSRSIGRGNRTYIARSVHTVKYIPYLDGDALADSVQEECTRMTRVDITNKKNKLSSQRRCAEVAGRWLGRLTEILQEICLDIEDVLQWVDAARGSKCPYCDFSAASVLATPQHVQKHVQNIKSRGQSHDADHQRRTRCWWLIQMFVELTGHSIIHVAKEYLRRMPPVTDKSGDLSQTGLQICAMCFSFNCTLHGYTLDQSVYYRSPKKGQQLPAGAIFRADRQAEADADDGEFNQRTRALLKLPTEGHICGIFCIATQASENVDVDDLLGFEGSRLVGRYNSAYTYHQAEKICGPQCFLRREMRDKAINIQSRSPSDIVRRMLRLYPKKLDVACLMAEKLQTSCMEMWYDILAVHANPNHGSSGTETDRETVLRLPQKFRPFDPKMLNEELPPFLPCSHAGPCGQREDGSYTCTCAELRIYCESSCVCSSRCTRRFKGCNCKAGPSKTCYMNNLRCACSQAGRECDPWVCNGCGSAEVLAPHYKYNPDIRAGRCLNVQLQAGVPARTYKGLSQVQGWGLYAGEDLEPYAFVGEYIGERISYPGELERRAVLTAEKGLQYFFKDSKETEIDGDRYGNKMRFINHSSVDVNKNVEAKTLYVNGENRILMHSIKKIKKGDELFYDYGYEEDDRAHFREKQDVNTNPNQYSVLEKSSAPKQSKRAVAKISDVDDAVDRDTADGDGSHSRSKGSSDETGSRQSSHQHLKRKRRIISISDDDLTGSNTSRSQGRRSLAVSAQPPSCENERSDANNTGSMSDAASDSDFEIELDEALDESQESTVDEELEEISDSDDSLQHETAVSTRAEQAKQLRRRHDSAVSPIIDGSRVSNRPEYARAQNRGSIHSERHDATRDQRAFNQAAPPPITIRLITRKNGFSGRSSSSSNSNSRRGQIDRTTS